MSYQPYPIISPKATGMQRDLEPFQLDDLAYPDLEDCYWWRGRIKRRQGFQFLGRLNRKIGTTDGSGNFTFTLPNAPLTAGSSYFVIGTDYFQDSGDASNPTTLLTNGAATVHTLNKTNGLLTINGSIALTDVFYFPGLPVMGLRSLVAVAFNIETLIGFDTSFSYVFNSSANTFQDLSFYKTSAAIFIWHATNYDFFWTYNYQNAMFTTNYVAGIDGSAISAITIAASAVITVANGANFVIGDAVFVNEVAGMTEINGLSGTVSNVVGNNVTVNINSSGFTMYSSAGVLFNLTRQIGGGDGVKWLDQDLSGWVNFQPPLNGSGSSIQYLQGALITVAYKNRLLMLNTIEGTFSGSTTTYNQRVRWSQNGSVYYANPIPTNYQGGSNAKAWRDDITGRGGFIDAPTLEEIVSAYFVKDTLIVYFENSVWQLKYTGNELLPFIWEKINTELGSDSTFSIVPFDEVTIAFGNVGIHACNSVEVARIDQKIPDEVFSIQNENQGTQRIYGIRDFFNELVYWTYPYIGNEPPPAQGLTFPNKILVYNYRDQSYSYFNDSFTCFGYFQAEKDLTWQNALTTWGETFYTWISPANQQQFPSIVAGNQQGYVELFMDDAIFTNAVSISISQITPGSPNTTIVAINHNFDVGQFITINSANGITGLTGNSYKIESITDANTFVITTPTAPTGVFNGSGNIVLLNNYYVYTKRFNPFYKEGAKVRLGYTDFYMQRTATGQVTVNLYINDDQTTPVNPTYNTFNTFPESTYAASPETNLTNEKVWKRIFFENISQFFQLEVTLSDAQMLTPAIQTSDITIHGFIPYVSKSGRNLDV